MRNRATKRAPGAVAMAAALSLLVSACGGDTDSALAEFPISGVLITMDTTNPGALDIYGKDRDLTPHLKALSEQGVVFDQAHTVAPITLPAHTSMLTGLYPLRHGVRENGMMKLTAEADTLAERASAAGFETAAFVSASVLLDHYGLDQGFDVYDQPQSENRSNNIAINERSSAKVTDRAIAWLEGRDEKRPFFLWVHYFDPHMPYSPPPEFFERAKGNHYRAEVAAMDHDIGRLLAALAKHVELDEVTVAVVADHGEAFHAHGEATHAVFCYEPTIRVPYLIRFADGRRAGTRSEEMVSVVDLFPTFIEEMGIGEVEGVDGLSLAGSTLPEDRGVYAESYSGYLTYGWSPLSSWIDRDGKYLHSSEPEFYDLQLDPGETDNLLEGGARDVSSYLEAIEELSRRPRLVSGGEVELSPEQIRELNALGYAAAGTEVTELPDPLDPTDLLAPASQTELYAKSNYAAGLVAAGKHAEAVPILESIVIANPRDLNSLENLGAALVSLNRFAEAIYPLQAALKRGGDRQLSLICLGISYEKTGELEKSLLQFRRADELWPETKGVAEAIARLEASLSGQ